MGILKYISYFFSTWSFLAFQIGWMNLLDWRFPLQEWDRKENTWSEASDLSTNSCSDVTSSVTLGRLICKDLRAFIFEVQRLVWVISGSLRGSGEMLMANDTFIIAQRLYCCLLKQTTPLSTKNGSGIGSVNPFIAKGDVNMSLPSWPLLFIHSCKYLSGPIFSIKWNEP